ncbi:putative bifunctional diguanylate cyclase/phosphodiesterase [Marinobacterium arenosum]|uniref:putative bifunctional diguanylate cyclase/phosphodiesterase n=1 Tax=Marinobacterium arenosum TaxID=2862496 RepID=UPI001C94449D|nr:EAL domain-containing protein [Marinobacterium arenosum]MBY4677531.1 EAL domain-containing protein [Marinobacterium arenosum]
MIKLSPAVRISLGLVSLTLGILLMADLAGLTPKQDTDQLEGRRHISEALAVQLSVAARSNDNALLRDTLRAVVHHNDAILSGAIRRRDGAVLVEQGEHQRNWVRQAESLVSLNQLTVPLSRNGQPFGTLELRFRPLNTVEQANVLVGLSFGWILFIAAACALGYWVLIKRCLSFLDASSVIPGRVRTALDTLMEGVLILDKKNRIVMANAAFAEKVRQPISQLIGRKASELGWVAPHSNQPVTELPWNSIQGGGCAREGVQLGLRPAGQRERVFRVSGAPILDDQGVERGVLASFDDVTELEDRNTRMQKMLTELESSKEQVTQQNRQLHQLATRDPLTDCFNRRSLFDCFNAEFERARTHNRPLSCLMLDIDHFKNINDSYGHSVGDEVIKMVASILHHSVRENDVVGRYGGEEFCVLLPGMDIRQALQVAERCRESIQHQEVLEVKATASFGVSSLSAGPENPEQMVDWADKALYVSKESGRNRVTAWDQKACSQMSPLHAEAELRKAQLAELQQALERNEFLLYYQPQFDSLGHVIGAEALLRWYKGGKEIVSPASFISLVEESGLIVPLGEWVLREACTQLCQMVDNNSCPNFRSLSVNVSPRQFKHPDFVSQVHRIIQQTNIDPGMLKLELTESLLIDDINDTIEKMQRLKDVHIRFSIDDFGTGYSSLLYLRHLPLNQLKIDQSFVRDLLTDRHDAAIVNTIIAMAASLELDIIAEGVENRAEVDALQKMGCYTFQGHYFSRPLPLQQFVEMLHR